jgi:uncharacterized protein YeaO (DUF488 family)
MIQVARIYEPAKKSDGWRVLLDRLWPRGVKKENAHVDQWMKEIAPSAALRKWFGHAPERWPEFQRRYTAELAKKKELMTELKQAEKTHGTLTLVFGAKDKEHNQAIVLMNLLNKNKK